MTRTAAVTALAVAASPAAAAAVPSLPAGGVYPALQAVTRLARETNAGVGAYPQLRDPQRLTFPSPAAVGSARRFARTRAGDVAFAVADRRGGISGLRVDERFRSASLVKAMLFVAYLDKLEREHRRPDRREAFWLDAMVRVSDNDSATQLYHRLRAPAVRELAHRAGMRAFAIGGNWGQAQVTAADQARLFLRIERLVPASRRSYALYLLGAAKPLQTWGIPTAAGPGWRVFFKGGWRPDAGGQIVHQAALLERGPRRFAVAVLSDRNPSEEYGHGTVRGITRRLLGTAVAPARPLVAPGRLSPLQALDGYTPPEPRPLHPL